MISEKGPNRRSRYAYCDLITTTDSAGTRLEPDYFSIRPPLANTNFPDNSVFNPTSADTFHQIAWRALGNSDDYWVICELSNTFDPFVDLIPEDQIFFVGSLLVDIQAGIITNFNMSHAKDVKIGDVLVVESLYPTPTSFECVASNVIKNLTVVINPIKTTSPIHTDFSRVSIKKKNVPTLTIPSVTRVNMELLDFGNPMNVTSTS